MSQPERSTDDPRTNKPRWSGGVLLLLAAVAAGLLWWQMRPVGGNAPNGADAPGGANGTKTVSLSIDFGNGTTKEFPKLAWREGLTAAAALRLAEQTPPKITLETEGEGERLLVVAIDGVKNEGGGSRNWLYQVNGKAADRSAGIKQLEPGDAVRWQFGRYEESE